MWRDHPHVYFLRPVGEPGPVKIGWSALPTERLKTYQAWSPVLLELVARTRGGESLERRFHAKFRHLHMHGEWFRADPELTDTIAQVAAGTFDPARLPEGMRLNKKVIPPESIEAGRMTRRLERLEKLGVVVPPNVEASRRTYGCGPETVARKRAIIAEFVNAHAHLLAAATPRQASSEAA